MTMIEYIKIIRNIIYVDIKIIILQKLQKCMKFNSDMFYLKVGIIMTRHFCLKLVNFS